MARAKRFLIILIKPSHYDDNGYVIQWFRSPIPSNSLAARIRRKIRTQRRRGMKIENPIVFYPRRVLEALNSGFRWARLFLKFRPALKRVKADQTARAYTESSDEELNEMDLIQVFKGAIPRTHGAPAVAVKAQLRPALP